MDVKDEIDLNEVLSKLDEMKPLPAAVNQLFELTQNLEANIQQMSKVIMTDQVLTSNILKIANSPMYGFSKRIATISQAIVVLGFNGIRNLALGVSVYGLIDPHKKSFLDRKKYFKHSLAVALIARELTVRMRIMDPEIAFVAGILHDIGKLLFIDHFEESYSSILDLAAKDNSFLHDLEREVFNTDHTVIGKKLCQLWSLPLIYSQTVAFHHNPEFENPELDMDASQLFRTVIAANNMAKVMGMGESGDALVKTSFFSILERDGIMPKTFFDVAKLLPEKMNGLQSVFQIPFETTRFKKSMEKSAIILSGHENLKYLLTMALNSWDIAILDSENINEEQEDFMVICDDSTLLQAQKIAINQKMINISDEKCLVKPDYSVINMNLLHERIKSVLNE